MTTEYGKPFKPPADAGSLRRRDFMRNGIASYVLLCSVGARPTSDTPKIQTSAYRRLKNNSPFRPFATDLPMIPVLDPVSTSDGVDAYDVSVREGMTEVLPGFQTPIYGYEGVYPGPTIRARRGRPVVVKISNTLGFDTNVHLHGGYVPSRFDGHPMDVIAAGGRFDYSYPNDQDAATLWYHDHAHGRTARSLYYGLVSFYILEDDRERELRLPRGPEFDIPVTIADHSFNRDGSFRYAENVDLGFRGDTLIVNGAISPRMTVKRRLYRFRFLNSSNARSYEFALGRGNEIYQIGSDGGLLGHVVRRRTIVLHPAERVDVIIDFRKFRSGSKVALINTAGEETTRAVMRFDIDRGGGNEEFEIPKGRMRTFERLPRVNATRSFELKLGNVQGGVQWQLNGRGFDPNRIDAAPRLSTSELWQWRNPSNRVHPMHLHGMLFRMIQRSSGKIHPGERGWKDTVGVLPGETVTVQPWFVPNQGKYVFHCHALEHGDKSMMLNLMVAT